MNQAEINELIIAINEKSIILYGLESHLEKYPEIRQIADNLKNPDNEWVILYHMTQKQLLQDWYNVLNNIYYESMSYGNEKKIEELLYKIAKISKFLIEAIKDTKVSEISKEDKAFAELLTKYLKQYQNYHFITDSVKNLGKEIKQTEIDFKKLHKEFTNVSSKEKEINDLEDKGHKIVKELEDKKILLNQLVDAEANSSLLKLYMTIADQEEDLANQYRNWALLIFGAIGSLVFISFFSINIPYTIFSSSIITTKEDLDPIVKGLIFLTLSAPAWYLTRESSKHRQVAYKAKMIGTEIAAVPLYIQELNDEDRLELRKSLADRFFGQELYGSSTPKADNSSSTEQIKLLAEMNKVTVEAIKVQQTLLGKKEKDHS